MVSFYVYSVSSKTRIFLLLQRLGCCSKNRKQWWTRLTTFIVNSWFCYNGNNKKISVNRGLFFWLEAYIGTPETSKMESFAKVCVSPGYVSIISRIFLDQKVAVFKCYLELFSELFRTNFSNLRIWLVSHK